VLFSLRQLAESEKEQTAKFLGVVLDPTLNWHNHIIGLKKQLSSVIYALRRLSRELNADGVRQAYYGIFHAKMVYALLV